MRKLNPISFLFHFYVSVIITNYRLLNFIKDHRARMNAANLTGHYTVYIAALDLLITSFQNAISSKSTTLVQQVGDTEVLDGGIQDFADFVHAEEPHIRYMFASDHSAYLEFYPHGLTPFDRISRIEGREMMHNFWLAADTHSGVVGAPFVTTCLGFVTDWDNNRSGQTGKFASVNIIRTLIKNQRTAVVQQLIVDSGAVAINNSTDVAAAEGFFNFNLLYRVRTVNHIHMPADGGFISTPPYEIGTAGPIILDDGTEVTCYNVGDVEMWIYGSATPGGAPGALKMIVPPHSSRTLMAPLLGAVDNHNINGFVNHLTEPGKWRIDIHDAL